MVVKMHIKGRLHSLRHHVMDADMACGDAVAKADVYRGCVHNMMRITIMMMISPPGNQTTATAPRPS